MQKRIYLSSPHMGGSELKYIEKAFRENYIAPLGQNVDAFEEVVARYCGSGYAVALNSGTAAIHLALILLGVERGDEVIVSTFTFSATINPIIYQGAIPVLIDSERETWNMDPELLERALKERMGKTSGTHSAPKATSVANSSAGAARGRIKAIIVVHLYGMPANMDTIMEIANRYGIPVIEDAAEALGSRYRGKHVGTFGKIGVLSFNGNKIITTSGGGAIISNDKMVEEKARFLANQARDEAPHYQHSHIGYNYRMSNVLAGIGRGQMEVLDEWKRKRRENFRFYQDILGKYLGFACLGEPDSTYHSNRWLTTTLVDPSITGTNRSEIKKELESDNIETRPLWKPMHLQPVFRSYPAYLNGVSENLFQEGLCLPSGSNMTEQDKNRIVKALMEIMKV